jgi:hypothetical protein
MPVMPISIQRIVQVVQTNLVQLQQSFAPYVNLLFSFKIKSYKSLYKCKKAAKALVNPEKLR